jgi:ABC-type lipoprotein export system ATPase subunit
MHMAATPLQEGSSAQESIAELGAEAARQHRDFGAGSLIVCDRLVRIYLAAGIEVQALQGLDLLVEQGEIVALVGASGSGKSTLMNILAGLDTPTAGSVRVAGHDLAAMASRQRLAYRRRVVGFIWQQTSRNLLPYLTAQQNVELPMRLAGSRAASRRARAAELLDLLGLGDGAGRRPDQMSGGEQQRAAIAVALVNEPKVLLADEPTGELDTATAAEVFGESRARRDRADRHPRPGRVLGGAPGRRDQGRPDQHRDPPAGQHRRRRRDGPARGGVRGARPGRPAAAAQGNDRTAGHAGPGPPRRRTRPHRRLARPARQVVTAVLATDMLAVEGVTRTFGSGRTATHALRGVSFTVGSGQLVALRGRSGSGKTTLLNVVGGLDQPDGGRVQVAGQDVTAMSSRERMAMRRTSVAFVFQSFGLIPILSAAENVGVPLRIAGLAPKEREQRVRLMLDIVGLSDHARQRPGELSGGQQQRVAIARALAGSPQVLLADEPTGQLDSETGKQIMRLLRTVVQSEGVTALVATHDPDLIGIADSVLELEDGKIKDN